MNAADYIVLIIALLGLVDVQVERLTGKSLVEWITPEPRERRKA